MILQKWEPQIVWAKTGSSTLLVKAVHAGVHDYASCYQAAGSTTRSRIRSNPARPYIDRFISFSR
jgi:hypothetical protein